MSGNFVLLGSNPFFQSYAQSDAFGKLIFIALITLSILSWIVMVYKIKILKKTRQNSQVFKEAFEKSQFHPLGISYHRSPKDQEASNAFGEIYQVLKRHTIDILKKNRLSFQQENEADKDNTANYLSASDIGLIESHLMSEISSQSKKLEQNLFILATTVSLAPFLGLLGTVWGILVTFAELQSYGFSQTNEMVLGGLSMALSTTVLGLLVAIPVLISYNYLKSSIKAFDSDMEHFSTVMLAAVEMQYRKVDLS
ncbi:MAG: MotA/TolQ/ExbB proton channel family protein [Chlamydiota bacterium]